jgi:indole-3-glycerol phosphate synthase
METILERIIANKRQEVITLKEQFSKRDKDYQNRSLINVLQNSDEMAIITEFKRASPSKGVINASLDPIEQALLYEKNGASAISVLTDYSFFKGSFQDMKAIREAVNLPILCKDFMIDPIQIDVAEANGADLILLIVAALPEKALKALYQYAQHKGLEVLVEVHDEVELETALNIGADLIGINNRNLKTFEVNLDITKKLGPLVKAAGAFLVSESGLKDRQDVQEVMNAGANAILIGETMMRSQDIVETMKQLRIPFSKEAIQ